MEVKLARHNQEVKLESRKVPARRQMKNTQGWSSILKATCTHGSDIAAEGTIRFVLEAVGQFVGRVEIQGCKQTS